MLNLEEIRQDVEEVMQELDVDQDMLDLLTEHVQALTNEVERLWVDQDMLDLLTEHVQALTNEVERLRGEPERVLGYIYQGLMGKPWDSDRGPLTANCLWAEIGKWLDQAQADERERCAALCDERAAHWYVGMVGNPTAERPAHRFAEAHAIAEAIRERS
jgi:hypothetical protein